MIILIGRKWSRYFRTFMSYNYNAMSSNVELKQISTINRSHSSGHAERQFYQLDKTKKGSDQNGNWNTDSLLFRGSSGELMKMVKRNVIGRHLAFLGPFGSRKCVYVDHTATGQSLKCIEEFIGDEVLPYYGNTHTTTTLTSSQTTMYRHEARDIIRNSVCASEHDAVIFIGNGSTGAIHKIATAIAGDLNNPRPIVYVGPFEHHSNLLPWRDLGATMVYIPECDDGHLDIEYLERRLEEGARETGRDLIGSFSAVSNVNGLPTNDIEVTILMHKYGGIALWDYSAAAPHLPINMNPVTGKEGLSQKDAIYFSGHKFIGGPQTPGVLVAKKFLFEGKRSTCGGGGGTVFFVTSESHRYLKNIEYREEAGTPGIIESIRLGLVFRLQETIGHQSIISKEAIYTKKILDSWSKFKEINILGPISTPRAPIISFVIEHLQTGYYLHHNFVVALLNDLFGIQSRGGCACAGPYAQTLLGIDLNLAKTYENLLLEDSRLDRSHLRRQAESSSYEIFRPGFTRLSLSYYLSFHEVDFVRKAVELISREGWKLLPLYAFNPETGEFHHHVNFLHERRLWLSSAAFEPNGIRVKHTPTPHTQPTYTETLEQAEDIFNNAINLCRRRNLPNQDLLFHSSHSHLRWFLLPSEALQLLRDESSLETIQSARPFQIKMYKQVDETEPTPGSLPHQLLNSPWTFSSSHNKLSHDLDQQFLNDNEDDDYHTPGALVTGPSICFSAGRNSPWNEFPIDQTEHSEVLVPNPIHPTQVSHFAASSMEGKLNFGSSIDNPLRSGSPNVSSEDLVKYAMHRVTNEIANELKSELRGVIHQVEQGIESGTRERANSFNDKKFRTLKERTRTLSGHLFSGVRRHHSEDLPNLKENIRENPNPLTETVNSTPPVIAKIKTCADGHLRDTHRWHCPPKAIMKPTLTAIKEFSMLEAGDRVLVCLSGGKDSLSLLHTLHQIQFVRKKQGKEFSLGAVTVDPGTSSYNPRPLVQYLEKLNLPYFYEEQRIMEQALDKGPGCVTSICSFCSRMKRGRIYACARKNGYNVLAFGQHLDDVAESFFMSVFHNGLLRTMKASYTVKEGDLRVIRPFVNVREKILRDFAESRRLPIIPENCPACFQAPTERHRVKQLLAQQEILFPKLFLSIRSAIHPLLAIARTGMESSLRKSQRNKTDSEKSNPEEDEIESDDESE